MGEVYLAEDTKNNQKVAVKILAKQLTTNPEALERFKREGEMLRQLDHPNIIKFIDTFEYESQYVIVMEYVSGGSLHELIGQGLLSIKRVRQIILELCDALIRSHHLNIIHRDLKPENVLISDDGVPKLADFGVARLSDGELMTRTGTQVGTPYYMSPEAWEGKVLDAQADIWSLGVMFFEMLTGNLPFSGDTPLAVMSQVNTASLPNLRKFRKDIPNGLVQVIKRMLTRDKKKRYQTMRQVVVDLEQAPSIKRGFQLSWQVGITVAFIVISLFFGTDFINQQTKTTFPVSEITSTTIYELSTLTIIPTVLVETATLIPTPTPTFNIGSTMISDIDSMNLLYVPAGEFTMGSGDFLDEQPVHQVYLNAYWIDETEVTNEMYSKCVAASVCEVPKSIGIHNYPIYYGNMDFNNYPVVNVNWNMAKTYCEWAGRTLPTEAQWEKAARGTDGRAFPWGEGLSCDKASYFYFNSSGVLRGCFITPLPVKNFPEGVSLYGAYDMAGNVIEWVSSLYKPYPYEANDGREDAASLDSRVMRGGSGGYLNSDLRSSNRTRDLPTTVIDDLGFRCATSIQ